jgi:hypothetical protein
VVELFEARKPRACSGDIAMSTSLRIFVIVIAVAIIAGWLSRRVPAQEQVPLAMLNDELEQKARAARDNDPHAIRALTDEIFNGSVLARAAESLRDRVARCELAFRQGTQRPIQETDFVETVNQYARAFNAPSFAHTNRSQLQTLRGYRRRFVPDFVEPVGPREHGLAVSMSPAEAVHIALNLGTRKLIDPEYQVVPDEWDKRAHARHRAPSDGGRGPRPHARLSGTVVPRDVAALQLALEQGIGVESSDVFRQAHQFLDMLGLQR